jgi:uncharacterized membrane protein (DUF106 family)
MAALNALLDATFDLLFRPLAALPVFLSLSLVAVSTAVVILLAVRAASDQPALAAVKRQIHGDFFEMRLFADDLQAMFRAQAGILRHNATYLRLSLVPMLWISVPLILLLAQLQSHFGYAGVVVGEPVAVTAQWKSVGSDPRTATLDVPPGVRVETPALWFPALRQVVWLVAAERAGDYRLRVGTGGAVYAKTLHADDGPARRSAVRTGPAFFDQVRYPSEPPLPAAAPVASISVAYGEGRVDVFGWKFGWMTVYFVESLIFALLLRRPLRVSF